MSLLVEVRDYLVSVSWTLLSYFGIYAEKIWGEWKSWSECTQECGGGTRVSVSQSILDNKMFLSGADVKAVLFLFPYRF